MNDVKLLRGKSEVGCWGGWVTRRAIVATGDWDWDWVGV